MYSLSQLFREFRSKDIPFLNSWFNSWFMILEFHWFEKAESRGYSSSYRVTCLCEDKGFDPLWCFSSLTPAPAKHNQPTNQPTQKSPHISIKLSINSNGNTAFKIPGYYTDGKSSHIWAKVSHENVLAILWLHSHLSAFPYTIEATHVTLMSNTPHNTVSSLKKGPIGYFLIFPWSLSKRVLEMQNAIPGVGRE